MNIVTYEERIAKMNKPGDEDKQLRLAKQYVRRLRVKLKKTNSLVKKVEINKAVTGSECVLRKLRLNIFDIEDMLFERSSLLT